MGAGRFLRPAPLSLACRVGVRAIFVQNPFSQVMIKISGDIFCREHARHISNIAVT